MSQLKRKFIEDGAVDFTKVDSSIALKTQLDDEVFRAFAAEQNIYQVSSDGVAAEQSRALAAEMSLSDAIGAEISRAQIAEGSIAQSVLAEASRAIAAEGSLSVRLDLIIENTNTQAIDSIKEIITAYQQADQSLEGAITLLSTGETSRALAAEGSLADALASEISRAQLVEGSISSALDTEINRAQSAEYSLSQAILNEVNRAQSVEDGIAAAIPFPANESFSGVQVVSDQFVELANTPVSGSVEFSIGGLLMTENQDYTLSVVNANTRVNFINDLATGGVSAIDATDVLSVRYLYANSVTVPIPPIAFRYHIASQRTINNAVVVFDGLDYDTTNGAYNPSTGVFTCGTDGLYSIEAAVLSSNCGGTQTISLEKNNSPYSVSQSYGISPSAVISDTVSCVAGDTLAIRATASGGAVSYSDASKNYFAVKRIR